MKFNVSRGAKAPCIFRMSAKDLINDGCTANESGYCHRLDCPFVPGYAERLAVEEYNENRQDYTY